MSLKQLLLRVGQAVIVLLATYTLAFVLLQILPSDAVMARYGSPDLGLTPEQIAEIRAAYGVDKPLIVQYFTSLVAFFTGNLGYSVQNGAAVTVLLGEALPSTLTLASLAFLLGVILAFLIATLANFSGRVNSFFQSLPSLLIAVPTFWIGIILIQIVSFQLGWISVINPGPVEELILPVITLSVPVAATLSQVLIRAINEAKQQSFVPVVRARGASEARVFFGNILRNAALPSLTIAGVLFGELVGGAVVTETVFSRTGIGNLTVLSVGNRDTPVLMAVVVIAATVYVLINLIVDLLYPIIDPRLRRRASA